MDRLSLVPVVHLHQVALRVVNAQIVERLLQEVTAILTSSDALMTYLNFVGHFFTKRWLGVFSWPGSPSSFQFRRKFKRWTITTVIGDLRLRVPGPHLGFLHHKRFFYVFIRRQTDIIWCFNGPTGELRAIQVTCWLA